MFQVGLPCYLGGNSGRSVSINVKKTRRHFSRNIHGARMFPQCFQVSHKGNIVSSVSFCFHHANYAYATQQGILTKIRACEHLQKFCEHVQGSSHLIFATNSSKGQIFRVLGWDHSIPLIEFSSWVLTNTLPIEMPFHLCSNNHF